MKALHHWGVILHETPVVFFECWKTYNNTLYIYDIIGNTFTWKTTGLKITMNFLWNFADVINEMIAATDGINAKDYNAFGKNIAKITSDLVLKNPT
jgi:hypothetical protein